MGENQLGLTQPRSPPILPHMLGENAPETKYFYELTPERVLSAVEATGVRCTGRCLALNSMENRVYEVEIDLPVGAELGSSYERFRVVKFYRPGRWSEAQIRAEHLFLQDLVAAEVPVVAPLQFPDGDTLRQLPDLGIWYTVYPKVGGRIPDELSSEQLEWLGRLLARLHVVGQRRSAPERIVLSPATYGRENLNCLLALDVIPQECRSRYQDLVHQILTHIEPLFSGIATHRIHGDCHLGNILWGANGPFFLDFDDMLMGPAVQDVWLVVPGRDGAPIQSLLAGYDQFSRFDRTTLQLIEPLRALRLIHYSAWIARRWEDPAFQRTFPHFTDRGYWQSRIADLQEQLTLILNPLTGAPVFIEDEWS